MTIVKIVTDSTADIPIDIVQELGITVVPLKVHFGSETYADGIDIKPEEFYPRIEHATSLPTTSQPSPVDFLHTYKELKEDAGSEVKIISIHLSSALSGTVQSAILAKSMLEEQIDITVIDSKNASFSIGMMVIAAAEAANNGKNKEECVDLIHQLIKRSVIYFLVDSLHYLQKGGRIGKASALFGSLLNIKPILSLDENGEVYAVDKVRGTNKALVRIIQLLKEFSSGAEVHVGVGHSTSSKKSNEILEEIKQEFNVQREYTSAIGPVIGTHVGPNTLAIMMMKP
jgi:DegV family protein with EDD domain